MKEAFTAVSNLKHWHFASIFCCSLQHAHMLVLNFQEEKPEHVMVCTLCLLFWCGILRAARAPSGFRLPPLMHYKASAILTNISKLKAYVSFISIKFYNEVKIKYIVWCASFGFSFSSTRNNSFCAWVCIRSISS